MDAVLEDVASTCRIATALGLLDLMGHVSARLGDGRIATTPSFATGRTLPRSCRAEDVVVVDLDGRPQGGEQDVPFDLALDLAVYRRRPDVEAMVTGSPEYTVAAGIAGIPVLPLTHSQSRLVHAGATLVRPLQLPTDAPSAEPLVQQLGSGPLLSLAGLGAVAVGSSLVEALERLDGYEYLARLTLVTRRLTDDPRTVTVEESAAVVAERPAEKVPSRDPRRYYDSLDPVRENDRPAVVVGPETSPDDDPARLRWAIAVACRILAAQGTLAFFKEHVSHRVSSDDRYIMSPAKTFAHMRPEDIGEIGMEGDCEWLSGPYPPAPFRWYHRDLLRARGDVNAIVHTHELYGRAVASAGRDSGAVFRNVASVPPVAVFPVPTLAFREDHRRGILESLGAGPAVHMLTHGTDYVGRSLEEALAAAIHREQACRLYVHASDVGTPQTLPDEVVTALREVMPSPAAWWGFYAGALPSLPSADGEAEREEGESDGAR